MGRFMRLRVKSSRSLLLAGLLLASAVTMFLGAQTSGMLRGMVQWAFVPLGDVGMGVTTSLKGHGEPKTDEAELQRLREQVELLAQRLAEERGYQNAGQRVYTKAFGQSADSPVKLIAARVVAADTVPYGWTRVANVGSRDGAAAGMYVTERRVLTDRAKRLPENLAVLSSAGLVGRVVETGAFTARVQLVTDRAFVLRGQIRRVIDAQNPRQVQIGDRIVYLRRQYNVPVECRATGDGLGGLIVAHVPKMYNIRPGDVLETPPDDGALPAIVPVGKVVRVTDEPQNTGRVQLEVQPVVDLRSIRQVYLVVPELGRLDAGKGGK